MEKTIAILGSTGSIGTQTLEVVRENKDIRVPSFVYRKYPKIREALSHRCAVYNAQLEMVERMEDEGKIVVIRPQKPVVVDRIERDIQKLTDFYQEGYECAKAIF